MSVRQTVVDRQVLEARDINNIGIWSWLDVDSIIQDGLTTTPGYAGFNVAPAQNNINIVVSPGRFYNGANGLFHQTSTDTFILTGFTPIQNKKIIAVTVKGETTPGAGEQRSVAISVDDDTGEPQQVMTQMIRKATVEVTQGAESADPQIPGLPANSILVATVLMNPSGIELITMNPATLLISGKKNSEDIGSLNAFRGTILPVVNGLVSDLANLTARTLDRASRQDLARGLIDIARLKEKADLPDDYAQYGTNFFTDSTQTDTGFSSGTCKIENGLLFPDAAGDDKTLDLFNSNDPKAKKFTSGLILPAHNEAIAIDGPATVGDVSMSQYPVATHVIKTKYVYKTNTFFGRLWNFARRWFATRFPYAASFAVQSQIVTPSYWGYWRQFPVQIYFGWNQQLVGLTTSVTSTTTNINGILTAETFRSPRAMYSLGVNLKITSVDTTGDVTFVLCETLLGQPKLDQALSMVTVTQPNLKKFATQGKTLVRWNPALLDSGKLYAVVMITQGNHRIATVAGADWRDGTYFYGTDTEYFVGDLTKDIYMDVVCAEFTSPRNELVLQTLDLVGGIEDIKISAEQLVPEGTFLSYEGQIGGIWYPLETLQSIPGGTTTIPFRAVAVGTKDLMPAFYAGANKVRVSRDRKSVV